MLFRNSLLAVGLFALLTGTLLFMIWLVQSPARKMRTEEAAPAGVSILVAAHPITAGTLLHAEDMQWSQAATADIPANYLVQGRDSDSAYVGAVAQRDFAAGEPLISTSLLQHNDRGFLAAVLSPGKRAISVAVDAPQSDAGMILPGDRVDAILTQRLDDSAAGVARRTVGETVLHDLRVVAVDQYLSASAKPSGNDPRAATTDSRIPRTITLEVSGQDAEKLLVAMELGKIMFTVRSARGDASPDNSVRSVIWASDVSQAYGVKPHGATMRSGGSARSSIEVIHGSKIEHP